MVLTSWERGVELAQKLRQESMERVPGYIKDDEIPKDLGHNVLNVPKQVLTAKELEITEQSAVSLLQQLRSGKVTCTEVTKAFLRRATLAQKLVNCITEFLPDEALFRAAELDEHMQKHGQPIGPLHGLPISVKDHIGMKGKICSLGFSALMDTVANEDADILVLLRSQGAVFHVRTTQPQLLYAIDTTSKLWGSTVTPWNTNLMAGGSSGGEGALISMRGSLLGLGTDIGGSIRVPAACNGIYGFRPSARRTPYGGIRGVLYGNESILCVVGPLATSLEDCDLFMKVVEDAQPWKMDPYNLRMPWRTALQTREFTIGVMWSDGVVQPHPPIQRVLKETVATLKAAGIKVVEWEPYQHQQCWDIIQSLYFPDAAVEERRLMEITGEPLQPLSKWIMHDNPNVKDRSVGEHCANVDARDRYKREYLQHMNDAGVDFILCPALMGASLPLQTAQYWGYTAQWNLLDYPAVVFPAGQVNQEDKKDESYTPQSELDRFFYDLYSAEAFKDAPVALQLVARTYHDEELIRAAEVVEGILSK